MTPARRVAISATRFGVLWSSVIPADVGYVAVISPVECPDLPIHQTPPGGPLAGSVEEAVEQLRRALDRS